jgi:hypothetical protein
MLLQRNVETNGRYTAHTDGAVTTRGDSDYPTCCTFLSTLR